MWYMGAYFDCCIALEVVVVVVVVGRGDIFVINESRLLGSRIISSHTHNR